MRFITYLLVACSLLACSKPAPNTLNIGTIAGPETALVEAAKIVAEQQYGLNIHIVTFNDYNLPNEALQEGSLDANVFQHLPYLQTAIKAHGYDLEPLDKTFIYPMGIYSKHYKTLGEIPDKALIALPNDPSNGIRALLLLQKAGLITLQDKPTGSLKDIVANPKQLRFQEMDAAQLPRVLPDVAAAVINTTFALPAGLSPTKDALLIEDKDSPYANLIVVKRDTAKRAALQSFVKALHSQAVKDKANSLFGDAALPAW